MSLDILINERLSCFAGNWLLLKPAYVEHLKRFGIAYAAGCDTAAGGVDCAQICGGAARPASASPSPRLMSECACTCSSGTGSHPGQEADEFLWRPMKNAVFH